MAATDVKTNGIKYIILENYRHPELEDMTLAGGNRLYECEDGFFKQMFDDRGTWKPVVDAPRVSIQLILKNPRIFELITINIPDKIEEVDQDRGLVNEVAETAMDFIASPSFKGDLTRWQNQIFEESIRMVYGDEGLAYVMQQVDKVKKDALRAGDR